MNASSPTNMTGTRAVHPSTATTVIKNTCTVYKLVHICGLGSGRKSSENKGHLKPEMESDM